MIRNPRVYACKDIHITGFGEMVECGRTPGHRGEHMSSDAKHRWPQKLEVIDGDRADDAPNPTGPPVLSLVR